MIYILFVPGSIHLQQCEGGSNKNIPIWLIVFGCVSLVQTALHTCCRCIKRASDDDEDAAKFISGCHCCTEILFSAFLFVWIIVGSVWVFGAYDKFQQGDCDNCCNSVPYLISYNTLIMVYTLGAVVCYTLCCCCCIPLIPNCSNQ